MKLVADANVWYDIGTGRIDPDQFRSAQSELFATPTSLLEIASGITDHSFSERKNAAKAVLEHATGVTEDSETHLTHLWNVGVGVGDVSWIDGYKAIATAQSATELERGVADSVAGVVRRVGVSVVSEWREMHWKGFQRELVDALEEHIPGYRKAREKGKYKRIARQNRSAFEEAMRSPEVKRMLARYTYERVRLASPEIPDPNDELVLKAEAALAPYINAYSEYVIRCATEFAPQANDFGDSESFIYLQPGTSLVTSDNRWIKIAQAVCPTQIIVPVTR